MDGAGNNTGFYEQVADQLTCFAGGVTAWYATPTHTYFNKPIRIKATELLILDGAGDLDTSIGESSEDVVDYIVGGAIKMRMDTNGIAPGDNESMMWDVVLITLDGTSPDTVAYVTDESKIYGLSSVGHDSAVEVQHSTDAAYTYHTRADILTDVLNLTYGAGFLNNDLAQVIIHYVL